MASRVAKNLTIGKNMATSDSTSCHIFATNGLHIESNKDSAIFLNYFNSGVIFSMARVQYMVVIKELKKISK